MADNNANNSDGQHWDSLLDRCRSGDVIAAVYETADKLLEVRQRLNNADAWRAFVHSEQIAGLRSALREDPFSNRAVTKPRGYAGDAVLLDMAYRLLGPPETTTPVGKLAFEATTNSPGSRSVRARKRCLADFIDSLAVEFVRPRIASVACGHLRELNWSTAAKSRELGEFVGVDQDADSIAEIGEHFSDFGVSAKCATLKEFLGGKVAPGPYHGIYSAGLFDYLDDSVAGRATSAMLRLVEPGGRLLIANLTPSLIDIAYMEAVMDWWLTYRSKDQLRALAESAVGDEAAEILSYTDILGNVAFVEIRRRGQ